MTLSELVERAHSASRSKGWYEVPHRNIGEMLALIHSEVSEALESWRKNEMVAFFGDGGKPEGFPSEVADIVIRVADLCGYLGIDLERSVVEKMTYNATRPYRHGGKVA